MLNRFKRSIHNLVKLRGQLFSREREREGNKPPRWSLCVNVINPCAIDVAMNIGRRTRVRPRTAILFTAHRIARWPTTMTTACVVHMRKCKLNEETREHNYLIVHSTLLIMLILTNLAPAFSLWLCASLDTIPLVSLSLTPVCTNNMLRELVSLCNRFAFFPCLSHVLSNLISVCVFRCTPTEFVYVALPPPHAQALSLSFVCN